MNSRKTLTFGDFLQDKLPPSTSIPITENKSWSSITATERKYVTPITHDKCLPYQITYGELNQRDIKSKYAGSQCTSMSIAALAYFALYRDWSTEGITQIIHEGHRLHVMLREDFKLSTNPDRRIAIDDIRSDLSFQLHNNNIKLAFGDKVDGFTTPKKDYEILPDLYKCLQTTGFYIVTVKSWTQAVWRTADGTIFMFDSHGNITHGNSMAAVLQFPNATQFGKFIINLRGEEAQFEIMKVDIRLNEMEKVKEKQRREQEQSMKEEKMRQQFEEKERRRMEREAELFKREKLEAEEKQRMESEREKKRKIKLEKEKKRQIMFEEREKKREKLREEENMKKKLKEEERMKMKVQKEERIRQKMEQEEKIRKKMDEEEKIKKRMDEEERRRKIVEEEERRRKIMKEEERRRKIIEEEERRRNTMKEEERRRKIIEEVERRKIIEEEERRRNIVEDEERRRKIMEEEERRKITEEEEMRRKEIEEDEKRRVTFEKEKRKKIEEEEELFLSQYIFFMGGCL